MLRFFAIIICFGLAIASGAAGYFGHLESKQKPVEEPTTVEYQPVAATDLISDTPTEDQAIELSDFFFGHMPIGISIDENPKDWEVAYVPLFPSKDAIQSHNCICVILRTSKISSLEDIESFYEQKELQGFYVHDDQELPEQAFSRLARKYKSLDYGRCVMFTTEKPVNQETPGYWIALVGFAFFLSVAGWQSFAMMGDMKSRIDLDKEQKPLSDAAGLNSIFENIESENTGSSGNPTGQETSVFSFLDQNRSNENH